MDKFNEWTVSVFITAGSESVAIHRFISNHETDNKFILLHETKNDDGIRSFFSEVWELYVKVRPARPNKSHSSASSFALRQCSTPSTLPIHQYGVLFLIHVSGRVRRSTSERV